MRDEISYIIVVKEQEEGKFLISLPDFEGVKLVAESEKNIKNIAEITLKLKYEELKNSGLEIKEPLTISEVSKNLKDGEFLMTIPFKPNFNLKNITENLKDTEVVKEKLKKVLDEDIKDNISKVSNKNLGIVAGGISIFSTLFISLVTLKIPFFGEYSISFFRGLKGFASFSSDIIKIQVSLMLSGIVFLVLAIGIIYSSIKENKNLFRNFLLGKGIFFLVFYLILFIKIPNEATKFMSISLLKIILYIISLGIGYYAYKREVKSEK